MQHQATFLRNRRSDLYICLQRNSVLLTSASCGQRYENMKEPSQDLLITNFRSKPFRKIFFAIAVLQRTMPGDQIPLPLLPFEYVQQPRCKKLQFFQLHYFRQHTEIEQLNAILIWRGPIFRSMFMYSFVLINDNYKLPRPTSFPLSTNRTLKK